MVTASPSAYPYQVGGSLRADALSYVARQADQQLYQALHQGKLCYIFNARQVGKSSLRVQIKSCLEAEGFRCAAIDMTSIGSETVTPQQWYKGLTAELWRAFGLGALRPFKSWWQEQAENTPVQILSNFLEEILFAQIPGKMVIFLDEIDCILNLSFPVDDFFAWVRFCTDHRSEDPRYQRLAFVLLGVATPSDLIRSHTRTPFNIGEAIDLTGFSLQEALPLAQGLAYGDYEPEALLQAILDWTNGQPFLTQKICQLLVEKAETDNKDHRQSTDLTAAQVIRQLVLEQILTDWKRFDQPEHLRTIRDRLLADPVKSGQLLGLYRCILQGELIRSDDSREQLELLLSGLVIRQYGALQVKCKLYQEVFNLQWVQRQLDLLRPYAQAIQAWEVDPADESRLLRGKALADAKAWAEGQRLSDHDYRFLAASEALDRRMVEDSLQLARGQEVSLRLAQEQKSNRQQRRLIVALTGLLGISMGLAALAYASYRQSLDSEQENALAAVQAQVSSSQAFFGSNRRLDALISALQAKRQINSLDYVPKPLLESVDSALRQAVYRALERNRWQASAELRGVDISPDGKQIATSSDNGTIRMWDLQGNLLWSVVGHSIGAYAVIFSPDGRWLVTAGGDRLVKIWNRQGQLIRTLVGHEGEVWGLAISPDGQLIASGSRDRTVKLWRTNGQLLHTLRGYQGPVRGLAFSPNGQNLVTGSDDNTVRIWTRTGQLVTAYRAHDNAVQAVAYARNGQFFVTASWDKTMRVWSPDGLLLRQLQGNQDRVWTVALSPDDATIISGSWDKTIRLWELRNTLTTPLLGHTAAILSVAFSPDGQTVASASDDRTVRLRNTNGRVQAVLRGHAAETYGVAFSPDGQYVLSSSLDQTLKLWNRQGKLLRTFTGHTADVWSVAFSPNGKLIASASFDRTARLWNLDGQLLRTFNHPSRVQRLAFCSDGQMIATASTDGVGRLWAIDGELKATLQGHKAGILGISFSPDCQMIATASADDTIKLWRRNGTMIRTIPGNMDGVSDVQFSPNGQMIATSGFDGSIKIWRLDGTLISTLEGHQGRVWRIAWNPNPNSQQLASAGEDKLVLVWDLARAQNMKQVEAFACKWLHDFLQTNPPLTERERVCQN